tara:strand:+ start:556 stop:1650 length:1095 start_codon:yes stop_codon:yes gene_type:complete
MKNKIIFLALFLVVSCNNSSNERSNIQDNIYDLKQTAITNAIEKASPGVVGIHVETKKLVGRDRKGEIFLKGKGVNGSGFLVSKDGYVITNAHNVSSILDLKTGDEYILLVTFPGGNMLEATIKGFDPQTDIALLKIDGEDFFHCNVGNSDNLSVGEFVVALGNPFNLFADTTQEPIASFGIVSASDADFGVQFDGTVFDNMIQTDAAINPGNSGGPLIDANGDVIGMNTFVREGTNVANIGYAIPINKVMKIAEELKIKGFIDRGIDHGLFFYRRFALRNTQYEGKLLIAQVHPRVTFETGLSPHDNNGNYIPTEVLSLNGYKVSSIKEFSDILLKEDVRPGDIIELKILRDDKIKIINLKTQ